MARMIPGYGPAESGSPTAEPTLYNALRDLPPEFTVIHSLWWLAEATTVLTREAPPLGEIDFLILHPDLGILAVEVKGGWIRYEHPDFVLPSGERIKNPVRQVTRGINAIGPQLRKIAGGGPMVGYAFAVPESSTRGRPLPPSLALGGESATRLVIDMHDLYDLRIKVEEIMRHWQTVYGARPMRQQQIDLIVRALCPFADFTPNWSDWIEVDRKKWLALTTEQRQLLADIGARERLVIDGRSGTGKTVLASVYARDLAETGRKVLFVLFNRLIAERLDRELRPVGVDVVTFHALCGRASFQLGHSVEDSQAWYNAIGPAELHEGLHYGVLDAADVLILDEAQALRQEWIVDLTQWFTGRPILACCDETQVFAFEKPTTATQLASLIKAGPPYPLTQSLRSPYAVFDRLRQTLPQPAYPLTTPRQPRAGELEECVVTDPLKALQQILRALRDEGVPSKAIAVIHTDEKPNYAPDVAAVADITIPATRFRGMEAPVVIVYAPSRLDDVALASAYGRATSRCIAIYNMLAVATQETGRFRDSLLRANPEARIEIERLWPPRATLRLSAVVQHTGDVSWWHDYGAWYISRNDDNPLPSLLWQLHLAFTSDMPTRVVWEKPSLGSTWTLDVRSSPPLNKLNDSLGDEYSLLRWCDHCNGWTLARAVTKSCMSCDQPYRNEQLPVIARDIARADEVIFSPANVGADEKRAMSIFLVALARWCRLEDEAQKLLLPYLNLYGKAGSIVARILTGIRIVSSTPDAEISLDSIVQDDLKRCKWLAAQTTATIWRTTVAQALSAWMAHGWLVKHDVGISHRATDLRVRRL